MDLFFRRAYAWLRPSVFLYSSFLKNVKHLNNLNDFTTMSCEYTFDPFKYFKINARSKTFTYMNC